MWSELLAGAVGGVFTGITIPYTSYYLTRYLNKMGIELVANPVDHRPSFSYSAHNMRLVNESKVTLKGATAFIIIDYKSKDILPSDLNKSYNTDLPNTQLMLSWAEVVNEKNEAHKDINQGDTADLNGIRYFTPNSATQLLVIASESGFYNNKGGKSRVPLRERRYDFKIKITAENMTPITRSFYFDVLENGIKPITENEQSC